jgi:Zn-dependent oligopeptidase
VRTLFHELGHILHQMLSQASLASQAGTSVRRDFVEAPSQIMENFLREPAILARFARHWQTGEPIPAALAAALGAAANLNVAIFALLQAYYGRYDLAIHGPDPVDIFERHRALWADTLRAYPEGVFEPANIGHFFGYDAGYYGYLWSAVRGDDMWSRFREAGVLDAGVGAAYRRLILEPGDSRDPGELLREFLGREPTSAEFLRLRGLE